MNTFVLERDDNNNDIIIDTPNGGSKITIQQYQHIYNQITGKSEQLSNSHKKNTKISLEDLEILDKRIKQTLEPYTVVGFSSSYTAFYENDQKETSGDFGRFSLTVKAPASITDNITFTYNFAIKLPQLCQAQNYSISIRLINKWAVRKKLIQELPINAPRKIINLFSSETAEIKIDYIDYAVARNINSTIEDWINGLPANETSKPVKILQRWSHLIPSIATYFTMLLLLIGIHEYTPELSEKIQSFGEFYKILGISALLFYTFIVTAKYLGTAVSKTKCNT